MNILIIGSKGFIGSHCVDYFSKKHTVFQCDVIIDYATPNYFIIDATNANYREVFTSEIFDVCINCSGAASVPHSINNPLFDFELNTHNVFKQLESIRKFNKNCKYINLSSAAVYGNPTSLPVKESQLLMPISPYGMHKKMAEYICKEYYEHFKIQTCSLRIFSAYGPRLRKQLFWDLNQKYKAKEEIQLFGTGKESRDFIYISDLVFAIDCVLNSNEFKASIINIANGSEQKIHDVVSTFYKILGDDISFEFKGEQRCGDPINWKADVSKLREIGYKQKVDINLGLTNYIGWLRENE